MTAAINATALTFGIGVVLSCLVETLQWKRRGGITFIRIGRISLSVCKAKE